MNEFLKNYIEVNNCKGFIQIIQYVNGFYIGTLEVKNDDIIKLIKKLLNSLECVEK